MHETVIAKAIIEEAKKQGKVRSITVEVGDLGHLPAHELKNHLESIVKWKVNVIQKKATVTCVCGFYGEPRIIEKTHGHTLFTCPHCGNTPSIIEGENIVLKSVEVD